MAIRSVAILVLGCGPVAALAGDALFNSGLEPGLVIQGRSAYEPRLSGGIARASAGGHEVAVAIRADGGYALVLESRYLGDDPTVLLTARGRDALSHVVWAGQLGPASRLVEAAGADGVLQATEEALVNLSAWSTAASAAMWAHNGFAPILDPLAYERAIRSYPSASQEVAYALALLARGELPMPAGHDDTWSLLASLAGAQVLVADYRQLLSAIGTCSTTPVPPLCEVAATLGLDPEVFPPMAPGLGVAYGPAFPGNQVADRQAVVEFDAPGQGRLVGLAGSPVAEQAIAWEATPQGRLRIVRVDGQPFAVRTQFVFVPGVGSIPRELRTMARHLRLAVGPGGLALSSWADEIEFSHPDNPDVPGGSTPPPAGWAFPDASQRLPAALLAGVPPLQGRVLLPTPRQSNDPSQIGLGAYAYDILDFQTGTAQRSGLTFSTDQQAADRFTLQFSDGRLGHYRVQAEDSPEAWRVLLAVEAGAERDHVQGIVLAVDSPAPVFTIGNVPGAWRTEINGQTCRGAWGEIGALDPFNFCGPPYFGFRFDPGGTGTVLLGGQISWQVLGGANAGRLELTRLSGANPTQRRAYEMVQDRGGRRWALENWSNQVGQPLPPVTAFVPTHRLTELILVPD